MNILPNCIKAACLAVLCFSALIGCQSSFESSKTDKSVEPLKILLLSANKSVKDYSACESFSSELAMPLLADDLAETMKAMNHAPISLEQSCEPTDTSELFCQVALKSSAGELVFSRHYQFMLNPDTKQMDQLKCFNLP